MRARSSTVPSSIRRKPSSSSASASPGRRRRPSGSGSLSSVALAATKKLIAAKTIQAKDRVVVVSTASALKFTEFKLGYHEKKLPMVTSRRANEPIAMAADVETVAKAVKGLR